jgi:hypothetical protein
MNSELTITFSSRCGEIAKQLLWMGFENTSPVDPTSVKYAYEAGLPNLEFYLHRLGLFGSDGCRVRSEAKHAWSPASQLLARYPADPV